MHENESTSRIGTGAVLAILLVSIPLILAGAAIAAFLPAKMFQGLTKDVGLLEILGPIGTGGALAALGIAGIAAAILLGPGIAAARRDLGEMLRPTIDNAERWVWALAGFVIFVIGVLAYLGPLKSEISDRMVAAETADMNEGNPWMAQRPRRVDFEASHFSPQVRRAEGGAAAGAAHGGGEGPKPDLDRPDGQRETVYVEPPPLTPGVQPTVYIGSDAVEKYRHFDDAMSVVADIPSEEIDYGGQPALRLPELPEGHPLAVNLGLQNGDIIVSVNERPVSKDMGNARQLFEELKNERTFRVVIDRNGQRFTVPYEVR